MKTTLRHNLNTINAELQDLEKRSMKCALQSVSGRPVEDKFQLLTRRMELQAQKDAIIQRLNRPRLTKRLVDGFVRVVSNK